MTIEEEQTPSKLSGLEELTIFAPVDVLVRFSKYVNGPMDWEGLANLLDAADMHFDEAWGKILGQ